VRLLVDADLDAALPAALRRLRHVQAWHVMEHGFLRAADALIVPYATRHRMLVVTNDLGISARRFPNCTHAGILLLDFARRDPEAVLARLRLVWRSGLRSRLPHSVTTIDNQGVKVLGPDPTQRHPDVFLIRPNWTARGARREPAAART
jgi:predicted nuclease of predicted toxin-antitoxin system